MRTTNSGRKRSTAQTVVSLGMASVVLSSVAACGSGSSSSGKGSGHSAGKAAGDAAPVSQGASQINVTLSGKEGCTLDHASAKSGPVTFTVTNKDATAISEVELQSDQRILGEKENLAPGLAPVSFTVSLSGGTYQIYCPGANTETQNFTVTGGAATQGTSDAATALSQGAKQYGSYVTDQTAAMVTAVDKLDAAVQSGNIEASKKAYAEARPFYEKIESDVEGFVLPGAKANDNSKNLDYLIDMRASNLDPKVGWHGFHAIERDLWQGGKITDSTKKMSTELKGNVNTLNGLVKNLSYKPEDLANGAADLLDEVQSEKIKGEEEAFSHLDLLDFQANVEGAQQAFAYLKSGLQKIDPTLAQTVSDQFDKVNTSLDHYRNNSALGGFKAWTPSLRASDAAGLSKTVQGLQDPLAKIAQKVATAQ